MKSTLEESAVRGAQRPRHLAVPQFSTSAGDEAMQIAALAGVVLDPWEEFVLRQALGERPDGRWAAFEVGLVVPRQNGKNAIIEIRELAGLFAFGEKLQIHTAHQFDTSLESLRRLLHLIESTPDFDRRVKKVSQAHGQEGIELRGGQRIRFRTRTKGGGRGFSGDLLVYDEAMDLPRSAVGATLPTLSARPNPQVWYTASAVDQTIHDNGLVLARVRERGHAGDDPELAYFEWCAAGEMKQLDQVDTADLELWMQANPGMGIRITPEHVEAEHRSLDPRTFAVERLGIGDWPSLDTEAQVISLEIFNLGFDPKSEVIDPVCFAFDVRPDRSSAAISVAGLRADGLRHIEVVAHRRGTGWVGDSFEELVGKHNASEVITDAAGPAAALLADLQGRGIDVKTVSATEHAQACGMIFDGFEQASIKHLGTPELTAAVKGAVKRPLGDAWAWSRKSSAVDITPLVSCTLANWGSVMQQATPALQPLVAWR